MSRIETIFFDWGGTLAQVAQQDQLLRIAGQKVAEFGAPDGGQDVVRVVIERILQAEQNAANDPELREADLGTILADWGRSAGMSVDDDWIAAAVELVGLNWRGSLQPFPGVAETLAELKRRGLRLGVVSNVIIPGRYCDMELEAEGYARFMDFKVYSSEVGYRKPSPKIYEHAIREAFGEAEVDLSRAMFVGDSPVFDVAEPARLGMKTALVTCYRGIWPSDHYEQSQPDYRIDSVNELPDLLS